MSSQLTVKYNATPPTVGDGQTTELQVDSSGNLKTISGATGSSANQVQGNIDSGAEDVGNPTKVGGKYNATLPTFHDGQRGDLQIDPSGNLRVVVEGINSTAADGVSNTNPVFLGNAVSTTGTNRPLGTAPYVYNGSTWDRMKKPSSISRIVSSANTTNATNAKASAGDLFAITCYNSNAAVRYLKLYNKASAPTVGTDTPVMTIALVPSAGFNLSFADAPLYFSTGISYALTTGSSDGDSTAVGAADILGLNLVYT